MDYVTISDVLSQGDRFRIKGELDVYEYQAVVDDPDNFYGYDDKRKLHKFPLHFVVVKVHS